MRHVPAWRIAVKRRQAGCPDDLRAERAAKEVRAFGLAVFLRARHDRLYDERIAEMRRVSKRQLRTMAAGDLASAGSGSGWRWPGRSSGTRRW